jgi:hypothetical protein
MLGQLDFRGSSPLSGTPPLVLAKTRLSVYGEPPNSRQVFDCSNRRPHPMDIVVVLECL